MFRKGGGYRSGCPRRESLALISVVMVWKGKPTAYNLFYFMELYNPNNFKMTFAIECFRQRGVLVVRSGSLPGHALTEGLKFQQLNG